MLFKIKLDFSITFLLNMLFTSKKVYFFQFCAGLSKKSKFIKTIFVNVFKRSWFSLSKKVLVYYANMLWLTVL